MSEPENPSTPKTSSVPLKKETVRITLRARPGAGVTQPREATAPVAPGASPTTTGSIMPPTARRATAPIQLPSAPLPPPAPKAPTAPVSLPPAPAAPPSSVSAPRPPTAPRTMAPGAPPPPAAKMETGAMTAPLARAPMAPRSAAGGAGTAPLAGGATGALPKATVKLQQTQPMARAPMSPPPSAPVKRAAAADSQQFYDDEKDPEAGLLGMSALCLVVAVVLMVIQMLGSDQITSAPAGQASAIMVPANEAVPWEAYNPVTKQWTSKFKETLLPIPE